MGSVADNNENLATQVSLEVYAEQGTSETSAMLYDNGLASIAVSVFMKVINGGQSDDYYYNHLSLDCAKVGAPVTTLDRATKRCGSYFSTTLCEGAVVKGEFDGHEKNSDQSPSGQPGTKRQTWLVTTTQDPGEGQLEYYLMACAHIEDFVPSNGAEKEDANIYSYMSYSGDCTIVNNSFVSVKIDHKPPMSIQVNQVGTPDFTTKNFPNDVSGWFLKVLYTEPSLQFRPHAASYANFSDHGSTKLDSESCQSKLRLISNGCSEAIGCMTYGDGQKNEQSTNWLQRCVSNGLDNQGSVRQDGLGSDESDAVYTFSFVSPVIGSYAIYTIWAWYQSPYIDEFVEYFGQTSFRVQDAYGSETEQCIVVQGSADSDKPNMEVDTPVNRIIHK